MYEGRKGPEGPKWHFMGIVDSMPTPDAVFGLLGKSGVSKIEVKPNKEKFSLWVLAPGKPSLQSPLDPLS